MSAEAIREEVTSIAERMGFTIRVTNENGEFKAVAVAPRGKVWTLGKRPELTSDSLGTSETALEAALVCLRDLIHKSIREGAGIVFDVAPPEPMRVIRNYQMPRSTKFTLELPNSEVNLCLWNRCPVTTNGRRPHPTIPDRRRKSMSRSPVSACA